jgi:hypothetical protein
VGLPASELGLQRGGGQTFLRDESSPIARTNHTDSEYDKPFPLTAY